MRAAVVGAGIVGASAARWLAEAGHDVEVFDPRGPGNPQGSSHGRSRIVRRAYPEADFAVAMNEAYPMWRELEASSGWELFNEVGLLYFGPADNPDIEAVRIGLEALGVEHRVLGPEEAAKTVTGLRLAEDELGIFTPEAGWADPEAAVKATLDLAYRRGAKLTLEAAPCIDRLRDDFDQVVIAAGSWIREWLDLPVRVTRQTSAYVAGRVEGSVWIEAGEDNLYGFPSEPGAASFKVGFHRAGPEVADETREPQAEQIEAIADLARRRFGLNGDVVESKGCVYTSSADQRFLIGRFDERVVYASACSGHGFKFGPWVGRRLAGLAQNL